MSDKGVSKFTPNSEITIYETEDRKVRIDVYFKDENLWLSQKLMAELFECSTDNISLHLENIYNEGELDEAATTEESSVVRQEGKILKSDIAIAKNYLQKEEIKTLNHIVDMYLDYAELQAGRGRPMRMSDWVEKLNAFLKFNEFDILQDKGKISREVANALAEEAYEAFRVKQDQNYISDFDRIVKGLKRPKKE